MTEQSVFSSIESLPRYESIEAAYQLSKILDERSLLAKFSEEEMLDRVAIGSTIDPSGALRPKIAESWHSIEAEENQSLASIPSASLLEYQRMLSDLLSSRADSVLEKHVSVLYSATQLQPPVHSGDGSRAAGLNLGFEELFLSSYKDLVKLATGLMKRGEADPSLDPASVVMEAWLKLSRGLASEFRSVGEFHVAAAQAMRGVLAENARRTNSLRHTGLAVAFELSDAAERTQPSKQLQILNELLSDLERMSPRQAQIVENRFFGGLSTSETAELLGVSESVVKRDWRVARAWLRAELEKRCPE